MNSYVVAAFLLTVAHFTQAGILGGAEIHDAGLSLGGGLEGLGVGLGHGDSSGIGVGGYGGGYGGSLGGYDGYGHGSEYSAGVSYVNNYNGHEGGYSGYALKNAIGASSYSEISYGGSKY